MSDSSGVTATPLTLSITFVEVALVTGSFLFIGQADNATVAQLHASQLLSAGTAPNTALTTDIAAVYQAWLTSATTAYVEAMTSALGTSTEVVAAVNTLELGMFSSVLVSDVSVLNATVDQNVTAMLSVNSSAAVQTYAYNVTLQVTVLTADMLLSVFVDVVNNSSSRRRLLSSLDQMLMSSDHAAVSQQLPGKMAAVLLQHKHTLAGSRMGIARCDSAIRASFLADSNAEPAHPVTLNSRSHAAASHAVEASVQSMLELQQMAVQTKAHTRSLQSTSASLVFPLSSLLAFKTDLVLAAFNGTSGCSTSSMTDLFYEDANTPSALDELCGTDGGTLTMNEALLASVDDTVPLLQVCKSAMSSQHSLMTFDA